MQPIQSKINDWVKKSGSDQTSWQTVLDHLHEILRDAQDDVEETLDTRLVGSEISDESQDHKSITSDDFSNAIVYILTQNKLFNNISEQIFITRNKSVIPDFEKICTISIGEETQKLDTDLIIYSLKENSELNKCIILLLKTSLRESIDLIWEWKLLMEIAMSDCEVRDKYEISYDPPTIPLICFVTVNFYNEINNPQHRGMFKFFDRAFIGKPIDPQVTDFIYPLSNLIDFVNERLFP